MRATSARAASAAPQGRPAPPPSSPPSSAALPRCARRALARAQASLPPRRRTAVHRAAALGPATSGLIASYERAARLRLSTHAHPTKLHTWPAPQRQGGPPSGGTEHVGPHVFLLSTTPQLFSWWSMSMVHVATCSPRARLGWFGGLGHVPRAPTTAQDAHFHRWMPMAMVATSYFSGLTSRVASGWLNDDGAPARAPRRGR